MSSYQKRRSANTRRRLRNNVASLQVSRQRLEGIVWLIKAQNKRQTETIKDLVERISILERSHG